MTNNEFTEAIAVKMDGCNATTVRAFQRTVLAILEHKKKLKQ